MAAALPVVLLVAILAAWGVDRAVAGGDAPRNVEVQGRSVGGLSEDDLRAVLTGMATEYSQRTVTIDTPAGRLDTTTGDLGIEIDVDATAEAVLALDRQEPLLQQPVNWVVGLLAERSAPTIFQISRAAVGARSVDVVAANRVEPVEPTIQVVDAAWEVVPGVAGEAIDADRLVALLAGTIEVDDSPLEMSIAPETLDPRYTDEEAAALAARADGLTAQPLLVSVADQSAELQPDFLRSVFSARAGEDELELVYDQDAVGSLLAFLFAGLHVDPVSASFNIGAGPVLQPSTNGQTCCVTTAPESVRQALDDGVGDVTVDLQVVEPTLTTERAESFGIVEPVASFSTSHACCASRVQNIHRMADIVRGALIEPGATFSLNEYVGPRTREKGFVEAGVIYFGEFTEDVGGGVSQFATTMFNAAFFAGLDFDEYMAHTIYISRYPYGREATVSWPAPDLKIRNDSPYGILIWPTYDGTTITVTLWSTKWVDASQSGQSEGPSGVCTRVQTERTRRFVDPVEADRVRGGPSAPGEDQAVVKDFVFALYQPDEGVLC